MAGRTSSAVEDRAISAYLSDATLAQAGIVIGKSSTTVKNILDRRGVGTRGCSGGAKKRFKEGDRQQNQKPRWMEEAVATAYLSGHGSSAIAKAFDISKTAVLGALDRLGIKTRSVKEAAQMRPPGAGVQIAKWKREAMVTAYLSGATARQAGVALGHSRQAATDALGRHGVELRNTQYRHDSSFFDEVEDEETAYWLGFVTADGYIHERGCLVVALQRRDRGHLQRLLDALKAEHPIHDFIAKKDGERYPASKVEIRSDGLCGALSDLGVENAKSKTVEPCEDVPDDLLRHYWRGVVDGDGSIGKYTKRTEKPSGTVCEKDYWELKLAGNEHILKGFVRWMNPQVGSERSAYESEDGTWRVTYGTKIGPLVIKLLYSKNSISLKRKSSKAKICLQEGLNGRR